MCDGNKIYACISNNKIEYKVYSRSKTNTLNNITCHYILHECSSKCNIFAAVAVCCFMMISKNKKKYEANA